MPSNVSSTINWGEAVIITSEGKLLDIRTEAKFQTYMYTNTNKLYTQSNLSHVMLCEINHPVYVQYSSNNNTACNNSSGSTQQVAWAKCYKSQT